VDATAEAVDSSGAGVLEGRTHGSRRGVEAGVARTYAVRGVAPLAVAAGLSSVYRWPNSLNHATNRFRPSLMEIFGL
jgi:hypothetical protein